MVSSKQIGEAIRVRRQELGISMAELGKRAGVTSAFIGMVEKNRSGLSLDSLSRIADGLEMSLFQLVMENEPVDNHEDSLVRAEQRSTLTLPDSGVQMELLTPDVQHKMTAHLSRVTPLYGNFCKKFMIPTEEFIYVLSGQIIITLGHDKYVLDEGDSIYFNGGQLTKLKCGNVSEACFICVISPPAY